MALERFLAGYERDAKLLKSKANHADLGLGAQTNFWMGKIEEGPIANIMGWRLLPDKLVLQPPLLPH